MPRLLFHWGPFREGSFNGAESVVTDARFWGLRSSSLLQERGGMAPPSVRSNLRNFKNLNLGRQSLPPPHPD